MNSPPDEAAIHAIERPQRSLWTYYWISALAIPPALPFVLPYCWFRYHSMRYKFTDEGTSMSWGILFHRQIIINYARIQDIHLRSNIVERWLGLARVLVQTASGSAGAEMTLEGLQEFEAVRDFLYSKMRGVKDIPTGLWRLQESTMSFANLQQVEVKQGPLQQLLGLADVHVQSAGGGGDHQRGQPGDSLHTGIFHTVNNAKEIRDPILERLRQFRQASLGDPDDHGHHAATPGAVPAESTGGEAVVAARELLAEARALRQAVGDHADAAPSPRH